MSTKYPKELLTLIHLLKKFPGVGSKTAERFAFQLLQWEDSSLKLFSQTLFHLKESIQFCPECGCLLSSDGCNFCDPLQRNTEVVCIVASAKDAFLVEQTHAYRGLYHVIEALLSPMQGHHEDKLRLDRLKNRLQNYPIKEVIIGLDSTLEADATALFLKNALMDWKIPVTRLAFGLPVGSSLEYIDGGTLSRAFLGRSSM